MRKPIHFATVLLLLSSCNQTAEIKSETSDEAKAFIEKTNQSAIKWYKAKQTDSVVSIMADEVIQFPPNHEPLIGKDSIKKYWDGLLQFGEVDFVLRTKNVEVSGPLAVELGEYDFKFTPIQNSPIPPIVDKGNYLVYWKKINNAWKVVWDAPVSSMPMPTPQK